jgi:hypothetical protein
MKNFKLIIIKNKIEITKINLYIIYLILPFISYMIPLYNIEPLYLCKDNQFSDTFIPCDKERICKEEFHIIDQSGSFISLNYEYFQFNKITEYCRNQVPLSIHKIFFSYYNILNLIGVRLGIFITNKFKSRNKINSFIFYLSNFILNLNLIFYIKYGVVFNLLIIIFSVNTGFCFFMISKNALHQYISCFIFLNELDKEKLLNNLNKMIPFGATIHIGIFMILRTWRANMILYLFISTALILIMIILDYVCNHGLNTNKDKLLEKNSESNSINNYFLKQSDIIHTTKLTDNEKSLFKINKRTSKSKSKKEKFYFDLFLFLLFSVNYQMFNNYFHIFSYNQFDSDHFPIFINGFSIFISEIISFYIFKYIQKVHEGFYTMACLLILATLLIIIQLCKDSRLMYLILPFLIFSKILLVLLYLIFLEKFKNPLGNFHQSKLQRQILNISNLSVVLTSLYTNFFEQSLFILSCLYYFIFVFYIKLI